MQSQSCSLCLAPRDNLSTPIKEDARETLAQCLPDLDIKPRDDSQVVCTNCSTGLGRYMEFKSTLLQAQASMQSFNTKQNAGLQDLAQVYLQNKGNGSEANTSKDLVVCRFCLRQVNDAYTPLVDDQKELILVTVMMRKCFPGLELGTMRGYSICVQCHEALEASYNFIKCLDIEYCIKKEDAVGEMEFEEGPKVKTELVVLNKFESGNDYLDLNTVKADDDRFMTHGDEVNMEGRFERVEEQKLKENKVNIETVEADGSSASGRASAAQSETMFKCNTCRFETCYKRVLQAHALLHKDPSEPFMCECTSRAQSMYDLASNKLLPKSSSEITMCTCNVSPANAVRTTFTEHMVLLGKPSRYKCESCSYMTRDKRNFTRHKLTHDNPTYRCKACSYETKQIRNYNYHMLMHNNPSKAHMFKCEVCAYRTNWRSHFMRHILVHKNSSEMTTYKCANCLFETRYKRSLQRHVAIHSSV